MQPVGFVTDVEIGLAASAAVIASRKSFDVGDCLLLPKPTYKLSMRPRYKISSCGEIRNASGVNQDDIHSFCSSQQPGEDTAMYQELKRMMSATFQRRAGRKNEQVTCKYADDYYGDKICVSVEQ